MEDGLISIEVDADKTCYSITPDGSVLTSVDGAISSNWGGGYVGECILYIPKNTTLFSLESSEFSGVLETITKAEINLQSCINLTGVIAKNSTEIDVSGCAGLTSDALELWAKATYKQKTKNGTIIGSTSDFDNWTNSYYADLIVDELDWELIFNP